MDAFVQGVFSKLGTEELDSIKMPCNYTLHGYLKITWMD
jgi:hypothetical protein